MGLHDRYARVTPYELSLPDLARARTRFRALTEEVEERGELADPGRFQLSPAAAAVLEKLHADEEETETLEGRGLLLFHAFHFWDAGEQLYLLGVSLTRQLMAGSSTPWRGEVPASAGYVQLPQHLVWTDPGPESAPESVDGFFWSAPEGTGELSVLLATGLRGDRAGFSITPILPAPLADAPEWMDLLGREEGGDFTSRMPGSELEGLHQVRTAGEVLKLAARCFAWLSGHAPSEPESAASEGPPLPSRIPYRRVEIG